jgi:hypothetical protein
MRDPLSRLLETEKAWLQVSFLVFLIAGLALAAWLLRNREMEFIYSLF